MSKNISHIATVTDVSPEGVTVTLQSASACGSCHAKGACSMGDTKDKVITVSPSFQLFEVGEKVNLILRQSLGMRAVAVAYISPLIVMFFSLVLLLLLQVPELYAGLGSMLVLLVYYVVLFVFRHKLEKQFSFEIEKIDSN